MSGARASSMGLERSSSPRRMARARAARRSSGKSGRAAMAFWRPAGAWGTTAVARSWSTLVQSAGSVRRGRRGAACRAGGSGGAGLHPAGRWGRGGRAGFAGRRRGGPRRRGSRPSRGLPQVAQALGPPGEDVGRGQPVGAGVGGTLGGDLFGAEEGGHVCWVSCGGGVSRADESALVVLTCRSSACTRPGGAAWPRRG
jgi:hypothetical protein